MVGSYREKGRQRETRGLMEAAEKGRELLPMVPMTAGVIGVPV
jgi:hypothetical protein